MKHLGGFSCCSRGGGGGHSQGEDLYEDNERCYHNPSHGDVRDG